MIVRASSVPSVADARRTDQPAEAFDWVEPAACGLDRGGWVSCVATDGKPAEMIIGWIDESYRLVAPRRLVSG